jgi:2-dehydro-3-deoxyphosphogluconate aldolase/(4S)-4-hydroxy-2-oxoglutarate aldolase
VFAIFRRLTPARTIEAAHAVAQGGIAALEITIDSPEALPIVGQLRERLPHVRVGVGTVLDPRDVPVVAQAGGQFIVCPHVDEAVIEASIDAGLPALPGAATATEVVRAWRAGASLVKLFPASALGPQTIRALREPLPMVPLVAVGGVDGANATRFLDAGAAAVGVGSWLTGASDLSEMTRRATRLTAELAARRVGPTSVGR